MVYALQEREEFLLAQQQSSEVEAMDHPRLNIKWKAPVENVVKVNWDAVVSSKNQKMGIGIVIRDANWAVMASLSSFKLFSSQPIVA